MVIADRGLAPMPVRLVVMREGGAEEQREVPVEVWLAGSRRTTVRIPNGGAILRLAIDPGQVFPDVDRSNNVWARP